jgi:hypothetical protein
MVNNIDEDIAFYEDLLRRLKQKKRDDICKGDHDWRDDSYENGHNGDWEECYHCKRCGVMK